MNILQKTLKVLADKNRMRILKLLEHKKMCVCELAHIVGITQPSISRHLKKLKSADLICCEQDGFWTNYALKKPDSACGIKLLKIFSQCINNDKIIKQDLIKAKKTNRKYICCTIKRRNNKC
jgi:ArsR family transcriptional regulator, arsenate/arsenite/antimonite-responsive transcriptional repressor